MRTVVPALFLSIALLLAYVSLRITERARISEQGVTVLMPLVALTARDLSHGDLIELVYDEPEVVAQVRGGNWPDHGAIYVTLDRLGVGHEPHLYEGGQLSAGEVVLKYRFGTTGTDIWPAYRRRLAFGDAFFLLGEEPMTEYLDARYAVLKVDLSGESVVTGLADAHAHLIGGDR